MKFTVKPQTIDKHTTPLPPRHSDLVNVKLGEKTNGANQNTPTANMYRMRVGENVQIDVLSVHEQTHLKRLVENTTIVQNTLTPAKPHPPPHTHKPFIIYS